MLTTTRREVGTGALVAIVAMVVLASSGGCGSSSSSGKSGDPESGSGGNGSGGLGEGGGPDQPQTGSGGGGSNTPDPCAGERCSGHGTCVVEGLSATCMCDGGYVDNGLACEVACADREPRSCFEGEGLPPGDDLVAVLEANRPGGVAPLAVVFDATSTTSTLTDKPFHDLGYCWSFDDGASGCFATTGLSKDQAYGPVAAHVFEEPGEYTVEVKVRDKENRESTASVKIIVTDPEDTFTSANTTCVSSSGNFDGCPDGSAETTATDITDMQSEVMTNHRILFRRGDRFSVSGNGLSLNAPGPGLIGAFGEGAPPIVSPRDNAFSVSGVDWRIVDLDIDGAGDENSRAISSGGDADTLKQLLMLRVRAYGTGRGAYIHGSGNVVQDGELRDIIGGSGSNILWIIGQGTAILGNLLENSGDGEHVVRMPEAVKVILSNNDIGEAPSPRHLIKLHGPAWDEGNRYSEKVIISDNIVRGTGGHGWSVSFGPQNAELDQRIRDVLFERNFLAAGPQVNKHMQIGGGERITVRSNIFYKAEGIESCIVEQRGAAPTPSNVEFYQNTVFTEESYAALVNVAGASEGFKAFNNLAISPGTPRIARVSGNWLVTDASLGNLVLTSPPFSANSPTTWQEFQPTANSAAAGAGADEYMTFWDFDRRPITSPTTPGALQLDP